MKKNHVIAWIVGILLLIFLYELVQQIKDGKSKAQGIASAFTGALQAMVDDLKKTMTAATTSPLSFLSGLPSTLMGWLENILTLLGSPLVLLLWLGQGIRSLFASVLPSPTSPTVPAGTVPLNAMTPDQLSAASMSPSIMSNPSPSFFDSFQNIIRGTFSQQEIDNYNTGNGIQLANGAVPNTTDGYPDTINAGAGFGFAKTPGDNGWDWKY